MSRSTNKTTAIIVAAGSSARMGDFGDKIFTDLCGKPVLQYSLEAFDKAESIDEIIVVTNKESYYKKFHSLKLAKIVDIVAGGADRARSVQNGLSAIKSESGTVAIHDGARPLITSELIDRVVANCPAIPAIAIHDTVKIVKNGYIESTPDRNMLFAAQTPQVFDLKTYREAVGNAALGIPTDDSTFMEKIGVRVKIIEGDYRNIKITTKEDLKIAEMLLTSSAWRTM
jgi:2-C-methyl-D-erythritol 4-phosphate cytidylyltransferase